MGRWHADAIRRSGNSVVAVADRDSDAARRLAARVRGCLVFPTCEDVLARAIPDVVHVCTPTPSHRSIAERCMDAGVHLVIEKPLAPTAGETEYLVRRAVQSGVLLCPVHQFVFQAGVVQAARRLPQIGRPVDVHALFCSAGGATLPETELDAVVADILPHPLSLMCRLLADGLSVDALEARRIAPGELRVSWQSGAASYSIRVSMGGRPTCANLSISGTEGTLHLDLFHGYAVLEPGHVSRMRKFVHPFDLGTRTLIAAATNMVGRIVRWEPAYPGLRTLIRLFYLAVRSDGTPPVSAEETIAVARVREDILSRI